MDTRRELPASPAVSNLLSEEEFLKSSPILSMSPRQSHSSDWKPMRRVTGGQDRNSRAENPKVTAFSFDCRSISGEFEIHCSVSPQLSCESNSADHTSPGSREMAEPVIRPLKKEISYMSDLDLSPGAGEAATADEM